MIVEDNVLFIALAFIIHLIVKVCLIKTNYCIVSTLLTDQWLWLGFETHAGFVLLWVTTSIERSVFFFYLLHYETTISLKKCLS